MFFASVHSKGVARLECVSVADARVKVACLERVTRLPVSVDSNGFVDLYSCNCRFHRV
jgi:hypothetical protein